MAATVFNREMRIFLTTSIEKPPSNLSIVTGFAHN